MVASVVATFAMDEADARRLEDNNAAQLIGALPFLAGCAHPERTALSHLTTLTAATVPRGNRGRHYSGGFYLDKLK